jgi:hypothetical protein
MYSSYIINNDSNPIENLEAELKIMDIRGVGYRRNDSMPPSLLKERDQAVSDYSACGLLGWAYCGLMRNIACASKNTTRFPDQQWVFSSGNALDLVKQYCTSVVKADSNMEIDPPILTGARTNAANHSKSLGSYWNQAIGNGTQLNLAVSLDQERCETPFNLGTAFEGRLDSGQTWGKEKEQSCIDTFMHIIQGVSISE